MGRLIPSPLVPDGVAGGGSGVCVQGRRFTHTAATFWQRLFNEARQLSTQALVLELSAPETSAMDRELLDPAAALNHSIARWVHADASAIMADTLAELEWSGPPALVRLDVRQADHDLYQGALPADCVDAETWPYFVAWLLEWSGLAACLWSQDPLRGTVSLRDADTGAAVEAAFHLTWPPLGDGLRQMVLTLAVPATST